MANFVLTRTRAQVARVFSQRCFYLFVVLLGVLVCIPIADTSPRAAALLTIFDALVLLAAVAAIGRTLSSFVLALGLAITVMLLQTAWRQSGDTVFMVLYLWFLALYLLATLVYLLTYVLRRDVMTLDKLYGAAAAYLLLAFLWLVAYGLAQHYIPGSFGIGGAPMPALAAGDLVYFSMTVLTTTGFGDIAPLKQPAKTLVVLEQIVGTLYVAILIARLTGTYPQSLRNDREGSSGPP
jgi:hypothetical protein